MNSICTCGAGTCTTPEIAALIEAEKHTAESIKALRREAFALYCADKDAGRKTRPVEEYALTALAQRLRTVEP